MFRLSISSTILRFYLMMVIVIVAVYSSQAWLIWVAMAVAVSAILGYRIGPAKEAASSKVVRLDRTKPAERRKAG